MIFWIAAGAMAAMVALAIWAGAWVRGQVAARPTAAFDVEVYRDQLRELDRDAERGVIGPEEAERARLEVSRRLLEADRALAATPEAGGGAGWPILLLIAATCGGAVALYLSLGSPDAPDLPLQARIAAIEDVRAARPSQAEAEAQQPPAPAADLPADVAAEINALRQRMEREPDDLEGFLALAGLEARLRNYRAARIAQDRAVALAADDATAATYLDLARLNILAAGGYVSPEAEAAINRALELDPQNGNGRFLLGAMYQRQGRPDLAFRIWRDLLADSPPDAPWIAPIASEMGDVALFAGQRFDPAAFGLGPLTGANMDQMAMIEGMVAGLSERLAAQGGTAEEWAQLIRALTVLGRSDQARAIYQEARGVFANDPEAIALLDAAALPLTEAAE